MIFSFAACGSSGAPASKGPGSSPEASSKPAEFKEKTVVDQDGVIVTLKSMSSSFLGQTLTLYIENNSEENITVSGRDVSVNGIMATDMLYADIAAGKKSNEDMLLMYPDNANIKTIANIEFKLRVSNSESWEELFLTDVITVDIDPAYKQPINADGEELVNVDGILIVFTGLSSDSLFGESANLYIENTCGEKISVSVRDLSVNGYMVSAYLSADVLDGKKAFTDITFYDSDFEQYDIEDIEEIEFYFEVYNPDTWDDIYESEIITLTF